MLPWPEILAALEQPVALAVTLRHLPSVVRVEPVAQVVLVDLRIREGWWDTQTRQSILIALMPTAM
jgi:hypothetical protein